MLAQLPPFVLAGLDGMAVVEQQPPAGRLPLLHTTEILNSIAARIEMSLFMVAKGVLDRATISLACERVRERDSPSKQAVETLRKAVSAIASVHGQAWNRLFIQSITGLYAGLHPKEGGMVNQEANRNEALRSWKVDLERIERMLARPNFNLATPYARRLIEQRQHLELNIAEIVSLRRAEPMAQATLRTPPDSAKSVKAGNTGPVRWEDIEISFLSDHRIQITEPSLNETLNYSEMGFEDHRKKTPKAAWKTLQELAESKGTIRTGSNWSKVEKRMQEIRKVFREHFGLSDDPLPFVRGTGYRARSKIGCGPSYQT
jgi:hypothetical protein